VSVRTWFPFIICDIDCTSTHQHSIQHFSITPLLSLWNNTCLHVRHNKPVKHSHSVIFYLFIVPIGSSQAYRQREKDQQLNTSTSIIIRLSLWSAFFIWIRSITYLSGFHQLHLLLQLVHSPLSFTHHHLHLISSPPYIFNSSSHTHCLVLSLHDTTD